VYKIRKRICEPKKNDNTTCLLLELPLQARLQTLGSQTQFSKLARVSFFKITILYKWYLIATKKREV
jgi:hypothetical protein